VLHEPIITVSITDGPIGATNRADARVIEATGAVGAVLSFEGIVRLEEDGKHLAALDYQAYEPMAGQLLRQLGTEIAAQYGLFSLTVEHSRGVVPVGCCSLRVTMESAHRGESLDAMREFISRLKQDVPIWKSPVWRAT